MDGTDDLQVPLRNIIYTDSPIGVAPIALPHTLLNEEEKNFESVAVITEEMMSSH